MGRPINKKFFGNKITPYQNHATGGKTGVGGEGVAAVAITNSGTNYSVGTTGAFSAPNISGGVQATASLEIAGTGANRGKIMSVTIVNAGTGYTSPPTFTLTTASAVTSTLNSGNGAVNTFTVTTTTGIAVGMLIAGAQTGSAGYVAAINGNVITSTVANNGTWTNATNLTFQDNGSGFTKTVTTTSNRQNALSITSFLTTGSSAVANGDILKQESSRRYLVRNSQGVGQVKLSAGVGAAHTLTAGNMHLIATDWGGATYYVMKLTAHKATVVNRTNTSTALISTSTFVIGGVSYTGGDCGWTLGAATGTNLVTLSSL